MHQRCFIFFYGGAPISWSLKKELVVALSSYEEECISAAPSICQAIWLNNLIKEISSENCDVVTTKIDNKSAIQLEKNHIAHRRRNLPNRAGQQGKPITTALRK